MSKLNEYWERVDEIQATLPSEIAYITSLDNSERGTTAGRVFRIGPRKAAEGIANQTHRVSTKPEIKAYHAKIDADRKRYEADAMKRKQQFAMPQELTDVMRAAASMVAQSKPSAT